jgi:hypothetical protein
MAKDTGIKGTKLYFDGDIWKWLKKESKLRRCSVSELVRRLVLTEMAKQSTTLQKKTIYS